MANLLSAAMSAMSPSTPGASSLPIPPEMIKQLLSGQPAFTVNRERAAAVLDAGFRFTDGYNKIKPALFIGGLVGMGMSAYSLTKRRARGAETWTFWVAAFGASAVTAWITRPILNAAQAPPGSTATEKATFGLLGIIDKRRATLKARDPAFADKVFARFDQLPVIKAQLDTSPLLKAVL